VTHGALGVALSREAGTTPPLPLPARDMWRPRSCPESGGGSQSHGDMWRPRSCPELRGGSQSRGDTWRSRICPAPGDGYHSTAPSSTPFRGRSGRSAIPIRPSLLLPGYHPTQVAPPPSTTSTTTTTSTSAISTSKGYHLHVVLVDFYSSHNIRAITTLQLRGMSVHRILSLTYSPALPSVELPL
jgi:hypothetical protein